jgi:hypothetical protein
VHALGQAGSWSEDQKAQEGFQQDDREKKKRKGNQLIAA